MENYNLTAELKKIASGITTSDPNTELGNINSGVGNLDTAMQGVATAINGISIPNTGSNIDGVATAINNKSIPDPSSNIAAVANAITNKSIPDPNTELANITSAINNLSGMFGGKFYQANHYNYATSGTWNDYTYRIISFDDLPAAARTTGKTFMLLHHIRVERLVSANIESFISLSNGPGVVYIPRYYFRMSGQVWPSINHISFIQIQADFNPKFMIKVATNVAVPGNINSDYILVPLN